MGYHNDLARSARWLASIQRDDGGWGLAPGQASSLVNTAEALYILRRTGNYPAEIQKGLQFIDRNAFIHVQANGPRIRYIAFSLMALIENQAHASAELRSQCIQWLEDARNDDNGWGTELKSSSELFPTFLAIWSLQQAGWPSRKLEPSLQWLLARARSSGWSLHPAQGPSPTATGYATLCLAQSRYRNHDSMQAARGFLLQTRQWGIEEEVIAGTVWKHCIFSSVIPALIALDENPYSTTIADGVRYINSQRSADGGWNELDNYHGRTVRAQFWSVLALDGIHRAFDPTIHVLRIDADRAEEVLSEPAYVKIAVHKKWAMILPSALYRLFAYFLFLASPFVLLGVHRRVADLPIRADAVFALAMITLGWFLTQKRPRYFPRSAKWLRLALTALSAGSLLFGANVETVILSFRHLLARLGGFINR